MRLQLKRHQFVKTRYSPWRRKLALPQWILNPAFDAHAKPSDLAYAASTHYSEADYKLAADTIVKALGLNTR